MKLNQKINYSVVQRFKINLFLILTFGLLSSNFTNAQNYPFMVSGVPDDNPFFKIDPLPSIPFLTTATTSHILKFGENYVKSTTLCLGCDPPTRGVFYGGNLGVCQDINNYELQMGKWSFKGAWEKPTITTLTIPPTLSISPGFKYLVDYHRWGNYSAHFGLREATTFFGSEEPSTSDYTKKDAVITWAYEVGQPANRLIFQSIEGVHNSGFGTNHSATEWATILSNGNIGSGTPNPTAQFQLKPLNTDPTIPNAMEILNSLGNSKFVFTKTGFLGLNKAIPTVELDVKGNVRIDDGNLELTDLATINDQQLFIDPTGKTYAAAIGNPNPNQVWLLGGNTIPTGWSSRVLGTINNVDLQFKAGNVMSFFIDGSNSHNTGFSSFNKNVIISGGNDLTGYPTGGSLAQDKDYSLTIGNSFKWYEHENDWYQKGFIKCVTEFGSEVMTLGSGELKLFAGTHKITSNNSFFNGTVRFEYIGPKKDLSTGSIVPTWIGSSTEMFKEIWLETGGYKGSDIRLKENIKPLEYGLKTILSLKPYSYILKSDKKGLNHHGFIAQELKEIFPNSIVAGKVTDTSYLGVDYTEFVPILTLAIQEQQSIIDSLKRKLDLVFSSNSIIDNSKNSTQKEVLNQLPLLFQNHPNPFNGVTFIDYFLPITVLNAFLKVVDNNGKLINSFQLNQTGFGQVELNCSNLASGTYHYSLIVNSELIDTKSMMINSID